MTFCRKATWVRIRRHRGKHMLQFPFCDAICGSYVKRVRVASPPLSTDKENIQLEAKNSPYLLPSDLLFLCSGRLLSPEPL